MPAPNDTSKRVFLCHSSGDKAKVREFYHRLKTNGVDPWLDEEDLLPGQAWQVEITKAVQASSAVLVFLSRGSVQATGFVNKEIKFALDVADAQPEGKIFVIPARLEDCEVPERLRHLQWVNLFEAAGYEKLLRALTAAGLREIRSTSGSESAPKPMETTNEQRLEPARLEFEPTLPNVAFVPGPISAGRPVPESNPFWRKWLLIGAAGVALVAASYGGWKLFPQGHDPVSGKASVDHATRPNPKDGLIYVAIPPSIFRMGCSPGDSACDGDETPAHDVQITKGFWMGQTEVTQAAYQKVMGDNPSQFKGGDLPVERATWDEAKQYCSAIGGRLPTEAEWEYAARGGSTAERYGDLDDVAWYGENSGSKTHPVAGLKANGFGLYDMLGNVWEWTADWYAKDYYQRREGRDPQGPSSGTARSLRGGSWYNNRSIVRASIRNRGAPDERVFNVGFRCVWEQRFP